MPPVLFLMCPDGEAFQGFWRHFMSISSLNSVVRAKRGRPSGRVEASSDAKRPLPVDVHVGTRIRLRRIQLNMSQDKLGESLGITFQQVQKYEKGTNRVGASRLQAIANVLQTSVSYFFDGAPGSNSSALMPPEDGVMAFLATCEGMKFVHSFTRIQDPKVRRKVVELIQALAAEDDCE